jgi:hypothetical protein
MTKTRKPIPKSQVELSQETITPYLNNGKAPVPANKRRENQKTLKNDEVKQFQVGLRDVDAAIVYYFDNVIRPSVVQNGVKINVPIIYGSPERWASVQKDGFYRDKNGKIQTPLIMFKRDSVTKDRGLGNKMDANNPLHFGVFEKKYSQKNIYDQFSLLTSRIPVRELYGVIIPDYVNLVYSCTIFTEYVEQMNKLVESINFASDSYWGDPERFKFRASIDDYTTTTELIQGGDRTVKTTFTIKIGGYIISDAINTSVANPNKFYSKSALKFGLETTVGLPTPGEGTGPVSRASSTGVRFYDQLPVTTVLNISDTGMTTEQIAYISLNNTAIATGSDITNQVTAVFTGRSFANPPTGFTITQESFSIYINSTYIPNSQRTVSEVGGDIVVVFDTASIKYTLSGVDEVVMVGKFN